MKILISICIIFFTSCISYSYEEAKKQLKILSIDQTNLTYKINLDCGDYDSYNCNLKLSYVIGSLNINPNEINKPEFNGNPITLNGSLLWEEKLLQKFKVRFTPDTESRETVVSHAKGRADNIEINYAPLRKQLQEHWDNSNDKIIRFNNFTIVNNSRKDIVFNSASDFVVIKHEDGSVVTKKLYLYQPPAIIPPGNKAKLYTNLRFPSSSKIEVRLSGVSKPIPINLKLNKSVIFYKAELLK